MHNPIETKIKNLDHFIDIYLRSCDLDNIHGLSEEKERIDNLMKISQYKLNISSDKLDQLLELIDEYRERKVDIKAIHDYYLSITGDR